VKSNAIKHNKETKLDMWLKHCEGYPEPTDLSVQGALKEVTAVHPVELSPPPSSVFITPLRHHQKQSPAFMMELEESDHTFPL
jgi:hypothetical protein